MCVFVIITDQVYYFSVYFCSLYPLVVVVVVVLVFDVFTHAERARLIILNNWFCCVVDGATQSWRCTRQFWNVPRPAVTAGDTWVRIAIPIAACPVVPSQRRTNRLPGSSSIILAVCITGSSRRIPPLRSVSVHDANLNFTARKSENHTDFWIVHTVTSSSHVSLAKTYVDLRWNPDIGRKAFEGSFLPKITLFLSLVHGNMSPWINLCRS